MHVAGLDGDGDLTVDVVVDCRDAPNLPGGIRLRTHERLRIHIPPDFPLALPRLTTPHRRWAKTPHVQWGAQLCLYRSPAIEWNPGDGIFGYVDRMLEWLERASAGQLDPDGEPIHPPVAYTSSSMSVVVHADAPRAADKPWLGIALLRRRSATRWDLDGWEPMASNWIDAIDRRRANGEDVIAAAAIVLPEPIGFEYPQFGAGLYLELRRQRASSIALLTLMGLATRLNAVFSDGDTPPIFVMLGAPGRGVAGQDLATHVVAWHVQADAEPLLTATSKIKNDPDDPQAQAAGNEIFQQARQWLIHARLAWLRIHEMRPETTIRRDQATPTSLLYRRRVLVLGAGALGAPTAEACVRGGATSVTIIDRSAVHPGILVRQPYLESDIDQPKADALAARLDAIDPQVTITGVVNDARHIIDDPALLQQFDLIIDATADRIARHSIEISRRLHTADWPALLTMIIGHEATRGIVTVHHAGAPNGAVDILRRLGQSARTTPELHDVVDDFYPDPPRHDLFQPEPGCSDATFVGSFSHVTGLAGQLLTAGLTELNRSEPEPSAVVVRTPAAGGRTDRLVWPPDHIIKEPATGLQIRISQAAIREMHAETRRGLRLRGRDIETGGMLFGQLDPTADVLWIDAASGPAPDSVLSATYFQHGTIGTEELRESHRRTSARTSDFIGYWHTHPDGRAAPSATDRHGMGTLVERVPGCRHALILILGGKSETWDGWISDGTLPDTYVRLARRGEAIPPPPGSDTALDTLRDRPGGPSWPGGFWHPPAQPPTRTRRWPILRRRSRR